MNESPALLGEMREALRAEFGARAIYRRLSKLVRDPVLAELLARFAEDEATQIEELRAVMVELGAKPRRGSLRRRLLAEALAWTTPLIGSRLALRICTDAEETRARWYAHFQEYLLRTGANATSTVCARLSTTKLRHAGALRAWVDRL